MTKYKLEVVRFKDENYEEEIDKILMHSYSSYAEAIEGFEACLYEAGFDKRHIEFLMKKLHRKGNGKKFQGIGSYLPNLHGQLGPGGYRLTKVEE